MKIKLRNDQLLMIEQTLQTIHENTIIVSPSGSGKSYMLVYLEKLLTDQGYNVFVYAPTIEVREQLDELLKENGSSNHARGIVSDYNNLEKDVDVDYLLIDEAHHVEADTYQLFFNKFPNAVRIGFSATPNRLDGKPLSNTFEHIVQGKQVRELIDEHIISDFKYYAPNTSQAIKTAVSSEHLNVLGERFFVSLERESNYTKTIYGDVVKTWLKYGEGKLTVLFAPSVKMSKKFAKEFRSSGIKATHIDGTTLPSKRKEIIDDFRKGNISVLCNVDLISEGFDMSDADCVILTRPTESLAMYMQQAFRALRYREGKTAIILDHADNISIHGRLDDYREWSLDGASEGGKGTGHERTIWERWNNNAVFDTSVELEEVIEHYDGRFDILIEKALKLKNMEGFMLLNDIQKEAHILSTSGYSWAYAFALAHGFDIPRKD